MPSSPSSKKLPKGVWTISLSSLFNDIASDATYPLLPLFLTATLGASPFSLGLIEGIAEATASILKFFSGAWSDTLPKKKGIVFFGYSLSAVLKPFIGIAHSWPQVLFIRFVDRVGKGIRSAPRDAWLSRFTDPADYPRVYGFHRGMDHTGAFIGPILAGLFLFFRPGDYRTLFLVTLIPGLIAVAMIYFTAEVSQPPLPKDKKGELRLGKAWSQLDSRLRTYFIILFIFALGNSTDTFLILRLKNAGLGDAWVPILWALLHLVRMTSSFISHRLVAKVGERNSIIIGWTIYATTYLALGFFSSLTFVLAAFLTYGLFSGFSEGPEKAMIAKLSSEEKKGAAFGIYAMALGLAPLPASLAFGFLWTKYGYSSAFSLGGGLAAMAAIALCCLIKDKRITNISATM